MLIRNENVEEFHLIQTIEFLFDQNQMIIVLQLNFSHVQDWNLIVDQQNIFL